jgi:polysaccharide export outer membrane protein
MLKLVIALSIALGTGACAIPRGAAIQSEIVDSTPGEDPGFALYAVDRALLAQVKDWPSIDQANLTNWPRDKSRTRDPAVAVGDLVELTVWENDPNSLLAGPDQKAVPLKPSIVSPTGEIFVPYVGQVKIDGLTQEAARGTIQQKLMAIVPTAQVQITVGPGRGNSVDVVGGVRLPGSYPFGRGDLTVLGSISQAGGALESLNNAQVRLLRGGKRYTISLERLYGSPSNDISLQAGDKLIVQDDKRVFLSLGAATREAVFPFRSDEMSALDALSTVGGISDLRADPKGILILRNYPERVVTTELSKGPSNQRVIFTLDLTSADGLFSAGQFKIMPDDLVLATEAPVTSARTVLSLLGSVIGVAKSVN